MAAVRTHGTLHSGSYYSELLFKYDAVQYLQPLSVLFDFGKIIKV
jgi:hypothetical protein